METLDLHGLPHGFVRNHVIRFIEKHWDKNTDVQIITGMSWMMQDIVINVLNEYKLEYTIGDEINHGYIKTII